MLANPVVSVLQPLTASFIKEHPAAKPAETKTKAMTCVLMEYILYIQCTVSVLMVSHNWAHVQRKVLGCNYCVLCWASTSWRFVAGFTHNKNRHTHRGRDDGNKKYIYGLMIFLFLGRQSPKHLEMESRVGSSAQEERNLGGVPVIFSQQTCGSVFSPLPRPFFGVPV